jgi:hypothetical protein
MSAFSRSVPAANVAGQDEFLNRPIVQLLACTITHAISARATDTGDRRAQSDLILNHTRPMRSGCELAMGDAGDCGADKGDGDEYGAEDRGDKHEIQEAHNVSAITPRQRSCSFAVAQ